MSASDSKKSPRHLIELLLTILWKKWLCFMDNNVSLHWVSIVIKTKQKRNFNMQQRLWNVKMASKDIVSNVPVLMGQQLFGVLSTSSSLEATTRRGQRRRDGDAQSNTWPVSHSAFGFKIRSDLGSLQRPTLQTQQNGEVEEGLG